MSRKPPARIGKLPPRYSFALNPYEDVRFSRCPRCKRATNKRKFALLIHMDGWGLASLGKTCRYCPRCEFIIAHQDELEQELAQFSQQYCPGVFGNDYLVLGTIRLKTWKDGLHGSGPSLDQLLENVSDFKKYLEVRVERGGWGLPGAAEPR